MSHSVRIHDSYAEIDADILFPDSSLPLCVFAPSKELVAYREQMSIVEFFNITTGQSP